VLSSSAANNQNFHKKEVTDEDIKTKLFSVSATRKRDFGLLLVYLKMERYRGEKVQK
jgi:hypothetical protein